MQHRFPGQPSLDHNVQSRARSHTKVGEFPQNCRDAADFSTHHQPTITEARFPPG